MSLFINFSQFLLIGQNLPFGLLFLKAQAIFLWEIVAQISGKILGYFFLKQFFYIFTLIDSLWFVGGRYFKESKVV
jgi:hypothetical protein